MADATVVPGHAVLDHERCGVGKRAMQSLGYNFHPMRCVLLLFLTPEPFGGLLLCAQKVANQRQRKSWYGSISGAPVELCVVAGQNWDTLHI